MKAKRSAHLKLILSGLAIAAFLSAGLECAGTRPPPPSEPVIVVPAQPHPQAVWVQGHYVWKRWQRSWVWVPGHWQIKQGRHWVIVY
jgi:hypothetical protein